MHQVRVPEGWVHWTSIKIEAQYIIVYYQQNVITHVENKSTLRSRKSTLHDAHARISTARSVRSAIAQK